MGRIDFPPLLPGQIGLKSKIKLMLIALFDVRCMAHYEFLLQDQTVNQHVYQEILQPLLPLVREKRRDLWESNTWLLHHNNAPAHTALSIRKFLVNKKITVLEHPFIRQIFLHVTFSFSPKLKISLRNTFFKHGCRNEGALENSPRVIPEVHRCTENKKMH